MSTQIEHLDNHTARLVVDVAPERLDTAMHAAAKRIANQVNIPGFRKGKAPYNIIIQRVGKDAVLSEAIDVLGNEVYREALEEAKIEPYAPGNLEDIATEPEVKLTFVVPKQPEVELGGYRDVRVDFEPKQVEDSAVEDSIKNLQDRRAVVEVVDRPAQIGDSVKAHVVGERIHPESENHEGDHEEHKEIFIDEEVTVVLSENEEEESIVPGFSAELVGTKANEEKTFSFSFPEDYKDQSLAHHTFNFEVAVQEVQARTLPELNEEFVKQVTNDEIDNVADLRVRVRKDLEDALKRDTDNEYSEKVLDKVVEQATVKYPAEMVEEYIDDLLKSMDQNLRERGLSLADYKRIEKKTDQALRDEFRDAAIARLKRALVLGKVVDAEQLTVNEIDVDARIDAMSQQFGEQAAIFKQMMSNDNSKQSIAMDLITGRSLKRLSDIAKGQNPEIGNSPEDAVPVLAAPEESEAASTEEAASEAASTDQAAAPQATETVPEPTSDEAAATAPESSSGDNPPA